MNWTLYNKLKCFRAFKPRFYYNTQNQKCQRFIYGGCKGNENNFLSLNQCSETCSQNLFKTSLQRPIMAEAAVIFPTVGICNFNGHIFYVGDYLKMTGDRCTTCTCSTPPSLTCHDEC